jgi:hypothetical protein
MGSWEAFEEDRPYVLKELRKGFLDYAEVLSQVEETRFFEFLLSGGHLDSLADSYPSPRKKHDVPLAVYIASELTLRLHGATGFAAYPFVIHAGGLKAALRQARLKYDAAGGRSRLDCPGYNEKNDYSRQTPCDQDYLRKLARDTKDKALMHWFGQATPRLYRDLGVLDEEGIVIVDGSHLFVPDNERYEGSAVGFFAAGDASPPASGRRPRRERRSNGTQGRPQHAPLGRMHRSDSRRAAARIPHGRHVLGVRPGHHSRIR